MAEICACDVGKLVTLPRNCPSNSEKKRKVDDNSDAAVMMVEEHYDLAAEDEKDDTVNTAVQDGGAASVLGSRRYIRKYMPYLLENGYDVRKIDIFRCQKGFRYGNSEHQLVCAAADPRGGQEDQGAHLREQGHGTDPLRQAHHGEIGPSAGLQREEDGVA